MDWKRLLIDGFPWDGGDDPDDSLKRSLAAEQAGLLTLEDTEPDSFDREEYGESVFRLTPLGRELLNIKP